jgi:hypothetical protein
MLSGQRGMLLEQRVIFCVHGLSINRHLDKSYDPKFGTVFDFFGSRVESRDDDLYDFILTQIDPENYENGLALFLPPPCGEGRGGGRMHSVSFIEYKK